MRARLSPALPASGGGSQTRAPRFSSQVHAFAIVAQNTARLRLAFPAQAMMAMLARVLSCCMFVLVWAEVARSRADMRNAEDVPGIAYLATAMVLNSVMTLAVETRFSLVLRNGLFAGELLRPLGFMPSQFAQALGDVLGNVLFAAPVLAVAAMVLGDAILPASGSACVLGILSAALAIVVNFALSFVVVQVALVTHSIYGVSVARAACFRALSGLFAPISTFPAALRQVADWTPFRHVIETPALLWHGRLTGVDAAARMAAQALWAIALLGGCALAFRYTLRRQQMQGG